MSLPNGSALTRADPHCEHSKSCDTRGAGPRRVQRGVRRRRHARALTSAYISSARASSSCTSESLSIRGLAR